MDTLTAPPTLDIFRNPNLSPIEADEAAMDWQDLYLKEPTPELKANLEAYGQWAENRRHVPFSKSETIEARRRVARQQETLRDWQVMGDDAGFDQVARRRGFQERYEAVAEIIPRDELRAKLARDTFVQDITGATPEQLRTGAPQLQVAKKILGIDDPSDEAFDKAMHDFIGKEVGKRDRRERMAKEGQRLAITDPQKAFSDEPTAGWKELRAKLEAEGMSPEDLDDSTRTVFQTRARTWDEYGDIIPLSRRVFSTIAGAEGTKTGGFQPFGSIDEAAEAFAKLPEEDFPKMVFALSSLADAHGQDVEGFFSKVGKSFERGAASYGLSLDTFMRGRQAAEFTQRIEKDEPIFIPVDEGSTPREAAMNAFRNLATGQGIDGFGLGADRGKNRRALTPQEREILRQQMNHLQRLQSAKQALNDHRAIVNKVESDNMVAQGIYDATGSLPYMAVAFLGPVGSVVNGAVMAEDSFRQLKAKHPGVEDAKLRTIGDAAAVPMALIERFQAKTLFGKFPVANGLLKKLEGGGFLRQLAVRQAAEFGQEMGQNAMLPLAQQVLEAFGEDMPEVDLRGELWGQVKESPRTFFATLPLTLLGVGGSAAARKFRQTQLDQLMEDGKGMQLSGLTPGETGTVLEGATTEERVKRFREIWQSKTPEQRLEASQAAMRDAEGPSTLPAIKPRTDGGTEVSYPDGTTESFRTEDEAVAAHSQWVEAHFEQQRQASQQAIESGDLDAAFDEESARFAEARPGVTVSEVEAETLGDLRRRGQMTLSQAWQRVKDYAAQTGTSLEGFTVSDFDRFRVEGSADTGARFVDGVLEGAITLAKGEKNVATLWEESSETYMAAQLNEGGTWTEGELLAELRRVEKQTGKAFLAGESRENLIEGFSFVARNYAAGNYADLNFGQKLKHVLNLLAEKIAAAFTLAKDMKRLSQAGELSPALESALRESLGFEGNQEAEMGRMRNEAGARITGETLAISPIGPGPRNIPEAPAVLPQQRNPFDGVKATTPKEWRPVWNAWLKENRAEWAGSAPVTTAEGPISITNQTADHVRNVRQGERAGLHFEAAVRLRELLENSVLAAVDTPKVGEQGAAEIHRRYAWMTFGDGKSRHVLLTVKRWNEAAGRDSDTAYALEALEVKDDGTAEGLGAPGVLADSEATNGGATGKLARFLSGIKPEHRRTFSISRDGDSLFSVPALISVKSGGRSAGAKVWKNMAAEVRDMRGRFDKRAAEMAGMDAATLKQELSQSDGQEAVDLKESTARQEADLATLEERREEERAAHAQNLDRLEHEEGIAIQDEGERLLAKWGPEKANMARTAMAEARKTVSAKFKGLRDKENSRHRAAMTDLDTREKTLRWDARDRERNARRAAQGREGNLLRQAERFREQQRRFELLQDIATLEVIAKALPAQVRAKFFTGFRKLAELRTTKARQDYLADLLSKVETALEAHLRREFRSGIRKWLKKGAAKVSEGRNRSSSIGAVSAAAFEEAKSWTKVSDDPAGAVDGQSAAEKASARSGELTRLIEAPGDMDAERLEELVARQQAVELFGDFGNATSSRLEQALAFLEGTYDEGRKERVNLLLSRRAVKDNRISRILKGLGVSGTTETADRVKRTRKDEGPLKGLAEGFMGGVLGGSQSMRRLRETTKDADAIATVEDMENAFLLSELAEQDMNLADNERYVAAAYRILGVKTKYGFAKKLSDLSQNREGNIPVTKIEGARSEKVSIPMRHIESILNGDLDALEAGGVKIDPAWRDLDEADLTQLEAEWELFNDLSPEEQGRKRNITFTRNLSDGERKTLGELSQLEGLNWYLTLRQPDQFEKLRKMGWDSQTLTELETWLKPEVKALGQWMVDDIRRDRDTIDAIHRDEKGIGLAILDGPYFPVTNEVSAADLKDLALDGIEKKGGGRSIGSLKTRVANQAEPAVVNALAVYLGHRSQMNFWKANVGLLREWGGIIRDDKFATGVKNAMGSEYYAALKRRLDRIEAGGSLRKAPLLGIERLFKKFVRGFALGTLGGRVSTLAVNTAAFANVTLEVPIIELLPGMRDVIANPSAFKDAWNSPAIRRRMKGGSSFEAQLAKKRTGSTNPALAVADAAATPAMEAINFVDTAANTVAAAFVWERTRKLALAYGATDAEARAAADRKVEIVLARAAQPTAAFARSEFELTLMESPLAMPFAMFMSEARKTTSIGLMGLRQLLTGKGSYTKGMALQQVLMAFVVIKALEFSIRAVVGAATKGGDDEDEEYLGRLAKKMTDPKAWVYALTADYLTAIPGLGEAGKSGLAAGINSEGVKWIVDNTMPADFAKRWEKSEVRYFDSNPNPLAKVGKGVSSVSKAFSPDLTAEERADKIIDSTQVLGTLIPGAAVAAQAANVAEAGLGTFNSFGGSLSDEDHVKLLKARYSRLKRELDELHGPTMVETGKLDRHGKPRKTVDKKVKKAKEAALVDHLRAALAPLSPELRKQALEGIRPTLEVEKQIAKSLKP